MSSFFYGLINILGLRKTTDPIVKKNDTTFVDIINRVIINNKKENNHISQPRNVTRFLYRRQRKTNLSPEIPKLLPNSSTEIIRNVNVVDDETPVKLSIGNKIYLFLGNWWYSLIIFVFITFQPIYTFVIIVTEKDPYQIPYLSNFFLQLIPPFQYYHSIKYFRTNHFEEIYKYSSKTISLNTYTFIISIVVVINILVNIFRLYFIYYDGDFPNFHDYSTISQFIILILLVISWVFGYLIILTNLLCFSIVFTSHTKIIKDFSNEILDPHCPLILNEILVKLFPIIHHLKQSISEFQRIISSFTFLGAISLGLFIDRIKNGNLEFFPWNLFIMYIIIQFIFFWLILTMNGCKNGMSDFIINPEYAHKYIKRYTIEEIESHFDENDHTLLLINQQEETGSIVEWQTLCDLLDSDWTEFKFFGINIADFELIKRGIAFVALILGINALIDG